MPIDLKELFLSQQTALAATLRCNRAVIVHKGAMGDASELDWRGMLKQYFPARYEVDKAIVLDADGNTSDQIDIVIYDRQYCPLLFNHGGMLYVPAESVYAVLEVKQALNKEMVDYASAKAQSVRCLRRTSVPIPYAAGTFDPKPHFRILAGILTLESDWSPPLGVPLITGLCDHPEEGRLDFGCALVDGAFEALYLKDGAPQFDKSEADTALIFFCLRLLQRLQQLGTVPALDVKDYGKGL